MESILLLNRTLILQHMRQHGTKSKCERSWPKSPAQAPPAPRAPRPPHPPPPLPPFPPLPLSNLLQSLCPANCHPPLPAVMRERAGGQAVLWRGTVGWEAHTKSKDVFFLKKITYLFVCRLAQEIRPQFLFLLIVYFLLFTVCRLVRETAGGLRAHAAEGPGAKPIDYAPPPPCIQTRRRRLLKDSGKSSATSSPADKIWFA